MNSSIEKQALNSIPFNSIGRIAVYSALLIGIFYTALRFLVSQWSREDYTYGYLVPFVFIYLIWEKRNALFAPDSKPSWFGFVPLCLGITLFWFGELAGEYFTRNNRSVGAIETVQDEN